MIRDRKDQGIGSAAPVGAGLVVAPLGIFGPQRGDPDDLDRERLLPLMDRLGPEIRGLVAGYLRSGTDILAWMAYTEDVIGNEFGVSGGLAVHTDGVYYWRRDAADYIDYYGIEIPHECIQHVRRSNWKANTLSRQDVDQIDAFLYGKPCKP